MNYPPIFEAVSGYPAAAAALSTTATGFSNIIRLFPAGEAPEGVGRPYATWQVIGGLPENYLGTRPDVDQYAIQIDVWADTLIDARSTTWAVREAIETHAYIIGYRGEDKEAETGLYHISFDTDWFVHRNTIA